MASATHVYRNGTILTMDSGGSQAQALAVRGETILAVGSGRGNYGPCRSAYGGYGFAREDHAPRFHRRAQPFSYPPASWRPRSRSFLPPVGKVKNIAENPGLIRAKAAETPKGEWILGFGYDDTGLEDRRHPLASDIDEVAPEHPVLLRHVSGHFCACNGLALAKVNYTKDTPRLRWAA